MMKKRFRWSKRAGNPALAAGILASVLLFPGCGKNAAQTAESIAQTETSGREDSQMQQESNEAESSQEESSTQESVPYDMEAEEIEMAPTGTYDGIIVDAAMNSMVIDTAEGKMYAVSFPETEDVVEKIGVDRAMKAARDADLIIYVVDGSRPLDESDREIIEFIRDRKTIVLLNKSDLDLEVGTAELEQICGHKVIPVSAKEEQGIELLEQEIKKLFYHGDLSFNDQVYITNARHKEALEQCLESLLMVKGSVEDSMPEDFYSIDLMNAYEQLGFIIGEAVDDDVVNEIFAKFCMGK